MELTRPGSPHIAYHAEGNGPTLVLIHGVGGDSTNWSEITSYLSNRYRIVRLDLRGHGWSGPIRRKPTIKDFARDVVDAMDAAGVGTCCLVGFSLGGVVAQSVALDYRERVEKLVLISTAAHRTDAERARLVNRLAELKTKGLAAAAPLFRDVWFTEAFQRAHPQKVTARLAQLQQTDPTSYIFAYEVFATTDLGERLGAIEVPTLIITGEHDVSGTPRMAKHMHESIKSSEMRIVPGLRHSLLIESPEQIATLLQQFFDDGESASLASR
jgi:(E)-2-((N-methylformamido)methylene)succinate hydrolase